MAGYAKNIDFRKISSSAENIDIFWFVCQKLVNLTNSTYNFFKGKNYSNDL